MALLDANFQELMRVTYEAARLEIEKLSTRLRNELLCKNVVESRAASYLDRFNTVKPHLVYRLDIIRKALLDIAPECIWDFRPDDLYLSFSAPSTSFIRSIRFVQVGNAAFVAYSFGIGFEDFTEVLGLAVRDPVEASINSPIFDFHFCDVYLEKVAKMFVREFAWDSERRSNS